MLFHLFTLPLVMFLGAIVCTAASRYEDDYGLQALTDQANDHQQIVYDVDNGVNASFACDPQQVKTLWNQVQQHLTQTPYENDCKGGHVVSSYISSLEGDSPKIQNVVIGDFDSDTGLLTVLSYEYRTTSAPWPPSPDKCTQKKTLWNDQEADLGEKLAKLGVTLPEKFPLKDWTHYKRINYPNSEVEQQCKRSLEALQCVPYGQRGFIVPSVINPNNLCIRVAMVNGKWATCYPAKTTAWRGAVGAACPF